MIIYETLVQHPKPKQALAGLSDVNAIDYWHPFMSLPQPIEPGRCRYVWSNKVYPSPQLKLSDFIVTELDDKSVTYQVEAQVELKPYSLNLVSFTLEPEGIYMIRDVIVDESVQNHPTRTPEERIAMLQAHAQDIQQSISELWH